MSAINSLDSLKTKKILTVNNHHYHFFSLKEAADKLEFKLSRLPNSLKVLLENLLRNEDNKNITTHNIKAVANWLSTKKADEEIAFFPTRVLMQDFTGIPAIVDLAAMRDAIHQQGGDPKKINPLIPVDLVIDHSVQVDTYGTDHAFIQNTKLEMQRNKERYKFLRWGQKAFDNFSVIPPGTGICHQVNLEYLAKVVWTAKVRGEMLAYPDTLVGTDSHTTMVNGLSVLGWGVGGIEAEAAMLGQPISMMLPEVVGFKLTDELKAGVTATDLVLTMTHMLRSKGVVGKFVEFYGEGLSSLSLADRATIANMAPEYGATCGFFPIDDKTLKYLALTGRPQELISLVEAYAKEQELWRSDEQAMEFSDRLELNLKTVEVSMAGPKRPQEHVLLPDIAMNFKEALSALRQLSTKVSAHSPSAIEATSDQLQDGAVVITAITSCTNTSNPFAMIGAGLLAKNAVQKNLSIKPHVKTSLAPGSQVVTAYLEKSGLDKYFEKLGFYLVGYGCTTCIGNSGPLHTEIEKQIIEQDLMVAAILSGNRNFEGRIHPLVQANYLASPILCVAYAIAGTVLLNLVTEPIGNDANGKPVYLADIMPTRQEILESMQAIDNEMFQEKYRDVFKGTDDWRHIAVSGDTNYKWDLNSTYIRRPPYFDSQTAGGKLKSIQDARILAIFGDSMTTDHISPAGSIAKTSPAAEYLMSCGIAPEEFNSYGARRGNHEVMMRGTFANIRIRNKLLNNVEGGYTKYHPTGQQVTIYDAAMKYAQQGIPLLIIAGKEYGTGSSRDWAAKGPNLLGIRAIIAESFERIHRSNLVGMGVFPFMLKNSLTIDDLNLSGEETINIQGVEKLWPGGEVECVVKKAGEIVRSFPLLCHVDTEVELEYIKAGGILHYMLSRITKQ